METNCGLFPRSNEWDFAGEVLHEIEGEGCYMDG